MLVLCPEHPKRDQNPKFTPLSETTSIPVCFIYESPPPGKIEYTEFLVQPVSDILNASYKEQKLPSVGSSPTLYYSLPKSQASVDSRKELRPVLRPISLTPALSKIAKDFIVSDYVKPALEEKVTPN